MTDKAEISEQVNTEMKQKAVRRARDRAGAARWDLDTAVFSFAVLIIVIILLFQEVGIEIVAPVALFGLAMVWLVGWRRGRQLYQRFYDEEISKLELELNQTVRGVAKEAKAEAREETIEERVQKALRARWK